MTLTDEQLEELVATQTNERCRFVAREAAHELKTWRAIAERDHGKPFAAPPEFVHPSHLSTVIEVLEDDRSSLTRQLEAVTRELERIRSARKAVRHAARDVTDWMAAEARKGNLRQNDEAPAWSEYVAACDEWDRVVREIETGEDDKTRTP